MKSPDTDLPRFHAIATFIDAAKNPATVDGTPTVVTDRADIWAVENVKAMPNGVEFDVVAQGPTGAANLTITGDADLGAGVEEVVITDVLERTATKATGGTVEFGPATA